MAEPITPMPEPAMVATPPGQPTMFPRVNYYTAAQMRAYATAAIKATRALALEEAARECDAEADDYSPAWSRAAIGSAEGCAERIRALIDKEAP